MKKKRDFCIENLSVFIGFYVSIFKANKFMSFAFEKKIILYFLKRGEGKKDRQLELINK